MFSGLYGNLPSAKDEDAKPSESKWAGTGLVAPPSVTARRQSGMSQGMAPPSVLRAGRGRGREGPGPVAPGRGSGGRGPGPGPLAAGRGAAHAEKATTDDPIELQKSTHSTSNVGASASHRDIEDEYDPLKPNVYEDVRRQREAKRRDAEAAAAAAEAAREAAEAARQAGPRTVPPSAGAEEDPYARRGKPQLPAWMLRGSADGAGSGSGSAEPPAAPEAPPAAPPAPTTGTSFAQKMLEKMGWKEGEGLGKNRQGIAAPLEVQKTSARSGIIREADLPSATGPSPGLGSAHAAAPAAPLPPGPATRVILLKNMVAPGEVDEKLDEEVGVECSKHGQVTRYVLVEKWACVCAHGCQICLGYSQCQEFLTTMLGRSMWLAG